MKYSKSIVSFPLIVLFSGAGFRTTGPVEEGIQAPQEIQSISIVGNRRIPESTILYYVKTKVGEAYDERQVFLDYWRLLDTRFFTDVSLHTSRDEGGVQVAFSVAERPLIRSLELRGQPESPLLTPEAVGQWLQSTNAGLGVDGLLDETRFARAIRAVQQLLEIAGHSGLKVQVASEPVTAHSVKLVFRFERGD